MRIANAPVSWGAIEFANDRGGLEYAQVLDEIRETGYDGTELGDWGFLPTEPEILADQLAARELSLVGAFIQAPLRDPASHDDGLARALRAAHLLAAVGGDQPFIILSDDNATVAVRTRNAGRIRPEHGLQQHQWENLIEGANLIARTVLDETGLRTTFHHHGGGYVETPSEVEELLSRSDPDLLGLCLDTGHFMFGGGDPAEAIRSYGDRIWHIHFKDFDPAVASRSKQEGWDYLETVRKGIFSELGMGAVDFPAVLSALRAVGYDRWIVVEQDLFPGTGTPKESAMRNRDYLRRLGI
ncbi:MAG: TIM barrel protein [Anaerolineae bacterium]|nr:MAG: TIM barrel protein [Anaerolineae bacterium]